MPRVKTGTISRNWVETDIAAAEMGLTPRQLRSLLKKGLFKAGKHYRVKNPTAARKTYLWHVQRCEEVLLP